MACAHSSCLPEGFPGVGGRAVVPNDVVPNSPASQGLQTSTVHSSSAFSATIPLPDEKLKLACWTCGSPRPTGRQLLWLGAGSLENAGFSEWPMAVDTAEAAPGKSAGLPISQIAATQATTIQIVPSMVRVARLRISPCQASQIAPMMTTAAR